MSTKLPPFKPTIRPKPPPRPLSPSVEPKPPPSGPNNPGPRTPNPAPTPDPVTRPAPQPGTPPRQTPAKRPGIRRRPPGVKPLPDNPNGPLLPSRPIDEPRRIDRSKGQSLDGLLTWATATAFFAQTAKNALLLFGAGLLATVVIWTVRGASIALRLNPWGAAVTTAVFLVFLLYENKPAQAKSATPVDLRALLQKEKTRYETASDYPTKIQTLRKLWLIVEQGQTETALIFDQALETASGEFASLSATKQTQVVQKFTEMSDAYKSAMQYAANNQQQIIQNAEALIAEIKRIHGRNPQWMTWLRYYETCFTNFKSQTQGLVMTVQQLRLSAQDIRLILTA